MELLAKISSIIQKDSLDLVSVESLKQTMAALVETKNKDVNMLETLQNSKNFNVSVSRIKANARQGLVLNRDYYLVDFKGQLAEIKTAKALTSFIYKYCINDVRIVRSDIIFKGDNVSMTPNGYVKQFNPEIENTNYENVIGGIAEVHFVNGGIISVQMSKKDFDKIKDCSPSKNSAYSPWNVWPIKMCENKLLKELYKKAPIDNQKLMAAGYKWVDDEVAMKSVEVNGEIEVVADEKTTQEAYKEVVNVDHINELIETLKSNPGLLEKGGLNYTYNEQEKIIKSISDVKKLTQEEAGAAFAQMMGYE